MNLLDTLNDNTPVQIVGTINTYTALLAEQQGHRAIYLSGGGVSASSCGVPDLGIIQLEDILIDVRRITDRCNLPLLVDIDTGFGTALNIARTIRSVEKSGASAVHIEDQVQAKRCGHRPNKQIVSPKEMCDRIKSAVDARQHRDFCIMARTDALANEGLEACLERVSMYVEAGADAIFAEAVYDLEQFKAFKKTSGVPILANITEFGKTPLWHMKELASSGVDFILYPLTAFRAMSHTANQVYKTLKLEGSQRNLIDKMQTREELYQTLNYHQYEAVLDALQH
jgi:methylisocitrate lyase